MKKILYAGLVLLGGSALGMSETALNSKKLTELYRQVCAAEDIVATKNLPALTSYQQECHKEHIQPTRDKKRLYTIEEYYKAHEEYLRCLNEKIAAHEKIAG